MSEPFTERVDPKTNTCGEVEMPLMKKEIQGHQVWYRPNSTDEKVLKEVIEARAYRRASIGFDVAAGEHWLDLGANIGAFAVYCMTKGATADCYEPEPECFKILRKNSIGFDCVESAVTGLQEDRLPLWSSSIGGNYYRGTLLKNSGGLMGAEPQYVHNTFIGSITEQYDGVKMDIEGSEFGILDGEGLLPECEKLCFEYHTSRDKSMERMKRRIGKLKRMFGVVSYVPELDRIMAMGGQQKSFHDRVIYCIGRRK